MDMRKYLELFVAEAQEHVQAAARSLTGLTDPPAPRSLNAIFRNFHSIKGMAASMGFEPIASLAHAAEDLFDRAREGHLQWSGDVPALALETIDRIESMVSEAAALEAGQTLEDDPSPLIARLRGVGVMEGDEPLPPVARSNESPPADPVDSGTRSLRCILRLARGTELPAARVTIAVRRLEELGTLEEISPPLASLTDSSFDGTVHIDIRTNRDESVISRALGDLVGFESVLCKVRPGPDSSRTEPQSEHLPTTLRIRTEVLDRFLDSMAGMITWRGALRESLKGSDARRTAESFEKLSRAIDALRDLAMSVRLLPFEHIIPRLRRSVRDLERRTGKEVELTITGADVAMDRSVLEEIIDPLNHVLRNAVDHGIDSPGIRISRGKTARGTIRIDVSPRSDQILIAVEDDGDGMNLDDIRRTALSRGYVSQEELATMSDEQTLLLTTVPGFSTAGTVTEISGRGVGLDVVRTRIEALHGHIKIRSVRGKMTRIEMSVPPTVALIDAFIVRCSAGLIAIPAGSVASVKHVDPARIRSSLTGHYFPVEAAAGEETRFMPLLHLDQVLQSGNGDLPAGGRQPLLTYGSNGNQAALAVQEVLSREELVVKPLGIPLENLRKYSGAALLNDGRVALVLDLVNVMENS